MINRLTLQKKVFFLTAIFVAWIVLTSIALFNAGNQFYGEFASNSNWSLRAMSSVQLEISALGIDDNAGIQVVHVLQDGCICNDKTLLHKAEFSNLYQLSPSAQFERSVKDVAAAGLDLPATPAILIFNANKLLYAGPYSTGPMCSISDSLIAPILLQQVSLPGTWLNGEAKACRCVVKPLA